MPGAEARCSASTRCTAARSSPARSRTRRAPTSPARIGRRPARHGRRAARAPDRPGRPGRYRLDLRLPSGERRSGSRSPRPSRGTEALVRPERPHRRCARARRSPSASTSAGPRRTRRKCSPAGAPAPCGALRAPARRVGAGVYEATPPLPPGRYRAELLSEGAGLIPEPGSGAVGPRAPRRPGAPASIPRGAPAPPWL